MTRNQLLEMFPIGPELRDNRHMDPLTAAIGGSAGASIIGGLFGASSAKKAAAAQQAAAEAARQHVEGTAAAVNPQITTAAANAGDQAKATAAQQTDLVREAQSRAAGGVNDAAAGANKLLDPYATAGATASTALNEGIAPGGDFNKTPTLADLQIDPGYAFRLAQGNQALERKAAASGGVLGGGFAKDAINYNQGAASQEYQNAFNRFQTSTQNRFSNLFGVSRAGQEAAGAQGQNLTGAATYAGNTDIGTGEFGANLNQGAANYAGNALMHGADTTAANTINAANAGANFITQGGQAKASGIVGGSNALLSGFGGATNTILGGIQQKNLFDLLKNPALFNNNGGVNPGYANNSLGGGRFGAGPSLPPAADELDV